MATLDYHRQVRRRKLWHWVAAIIVVLAVIVSSIKSAGVARRLLADRQARSDFDKRRAAFLPLASLPPVVLKIVDDRIEPTSDPELEARFPAQDCGRACYLGVHRTATGQRWLIAVFTRVEYLPGPGERALVFRFFRMSMDDLAAGRFSLGSWEAINYTAEPTTRVTIGPAHAVAGDASRFTVPIHIDGRAGKIDGQVTDNGGVKTAYATE